MGGEQQVLRRHGRALHRHEIFGAPPPLVGIAIHLRHLESHHDRERCARDARVRARHVGLDVAFRIAVREAIAPEAGTHGTGEALLPRGRVEEGEAPRLPVVRRGRPACGLDEPLDRLGRQRLALIAPDGAPAGHELAPQSGLLRLRTRRHG